MYSFMRMHTPFGDLALVENGSALTNICFPEDRMPSCRPCETLLLLEAASQLNAYFSGTSRAFTLPLAPGGTPFQQSVWRALTQIPYGETRTYAEIAREICSPNACRAVGMANHCNPIPILIPCHRVIGASGKLTGYRGGLDWKQRLLELEGLQSK